MIILCLVVRLCARGAWLYLGSSYAQATASCMLDVVCRCRRLSIVAAYARRYSPALARTKIARWFARLCSCGWSRECSNKSVYSLGLCASSRHFVGVAGGVEKTTGNDQSFGDASGALKFVKIGEWSVPRGPAVLPIDNLYCLGPPIISNVSAFACIIH